MYANCQKLRCKENVLMTSSDKKFVQNKHTQNKDTKRSTKWLFS